MQFDQQEDNEGEYADLELTDMPENMEAPDNEENFESMGGR